MGTDFKSDWPVLRSYLGRRGRIGLQQHLINVCNLEHNLTHNLKQLFPTFTRCSHFAQGKGAMAGSTLVPSLYHISLLAQEWMPWLPFQESLPYHFYLLSHVTNAEANGTRARQNSEACWKNSDRDLLASSAKLQFPKTSTYHTPNYTEPGLTERFDRSGL